MGCFNSKLEFNTLNSVNSSLINQLMLQDPKTVTSFPYNDITIARVYDVYDADTVKIIFCTNCEKGKSKDKGKDNKYIKDSIRIHGIDTPEMRGKYPPIYKERAIAATNFVKELLPDNCYTIDLLSTDKYGRLLGDVEVEYQGHKRWLSQLLIEKKYAVSYHGKTKLTVDQWVEFIENNPLP